MLDHTQQPETDLYSSSETVPVSEATPLQEMLGNVLITIDRPIFLEGYLHGYKSYMRVGRYLPLSATMLRDVLLKRCLEHADQPGLWSTGYVIGWVTALHGLPRRQRLRSLEQAPTHSQHQQDTTLDPVLSPLIPSLFQQPDFQRGLTDGQQAYRAETIFHDEQADHPSEDDLIRFFAGQVSYKAQKRAQVPTPYPYRVGFALAQLNAAVATMGTWPQHADASTTVSIADTQHNEQDQ